MAHATHQATFSGSANRGLQVGQNDGTINFHQGLERPETPPQPCLFIPFERDPDFVDRGAVLTELDEHCAVPSSRTALVGLGGVGKSQLAIEYAYRTRERSADTWVFWAHASNAARFEQSYRDIADKARMVGRHDPKVNIFKLVHDWLQDERRRWLLILDNVDDSGFLRDTMQDQSGQNTTNGARALQDYLPRAQNGSILITSRSQQAASKLVERKRMIEIGPMSQEDAVKLFSKKLGSLGHDHDVAALAAVLDHIPLAIVQAAAYIFQRAPRCSVHEYLEQFRKSEWQKTSLLDYEGGELRRDREAQNSVVLAWQISFDHIRQARKSAADLLSLMSFFDRQGIPEMLLRSRPDANGIDQRTKQGRADLLTNSKNDDGEHDEAELRADRKFEDDVQMLRDYSLVSIGVDRESFEMHSLVQLATRKWLKAQNQMGSWERHSLVYLDAVMPIGTFENWATCRALLPHVKTATMHRPKDPDYSLRAWANMLYKASRYACDIGTLADAAEMAMMSLKAWEQLFGKECLYTLNSMGSLGSVYRQQGRMKEAEELQLERMEVSKKMFGDEHPYVLASITGLAMVYWTQGRWVEAEGLQVPVVEIRRRVFGDEHPETLTSIADLASIYWNQDRLAEAEELEVKVAEICKRVHGDEHPQTLTSMNNLAATYRRQGRLEEAEDLGVKVIEARRRVIGDEHPDTLISIHNLALTYRRQGRLEEAEELGVKIMETRTRVLGGEHPDTLTSIHNLALIWKDTSRTEEAIAMMSRCAQIRTRTLGASHPQTVASSEALLKWQAER